MRKIFRDLGVDIVHFVHIVHCSAFSFSAAGHVKKNVSLDEKKNHTVISDSSRLLKIAASLDLTQLLKLPVKKFLYCKVARGRTATLLKINFFTAIFQEIS